MKKAKCLNHEENRRAWSDGALPFGEGESRKAEDSGAATALPLAWRSAAPSGNNSRETAAPGASLDRSLNAGELSQRDNCYLR